MQKSRATYANNQYFQQSPSSRYLTDCTVSDKVGPCSGPAFHFVTTGACPEAHSSTGQTEREEVGEGSWGGGGRTLSKSDRC